VSQARLLGRPVEIDEEMPGPAAGNLAIAFGDFRAGYLINDRIGVRVLRDPYTNKPYVMFYVTRRVGGGLLDPNAFKVLKIAA
jgi:HK97 family phage major capsid protein